MLDPLDIYGRCPHPREAAEPIQRWQVEAEPAIVFRDRCGWCGSILRKHISLRAIEMDHGADIPAVPFRIEVELADAHNSRPAVNSRPGKDPL